MTMADPIRFGVLAWPQYTDWASLRGAGIRAEELGYDSLWTWDHVYPIVGSSHGPMFEGYLTLAGWASATSRWAPRGDPHDPFRSRCATITGAAVGVATVASSAFSPRTLE